MREGVALVVGASEVVFEPSPGLELVSSEKRLVLRRPTSWAAPSGMSAYVPCGRLLGGGAGPASDERQASFLPILAITDGRSVPPRSRG
ncbi:MAG TPA: hypothetical protein VHT91_13780, partial [Kofleriaceae bacterium]|nr:hypothetical protein [Kofleriaceae bacterium]